MVKLYGAKTILKGISGELLFGEKVMLIGENGSGKSTLLKLILGEISTDGGEIRLGSRVDVGYLAQQLLPDDPQQSVLDYYRREAGLEEGESRHRLAAYLFYGADVFKPVSLLSGGEWTRLRLALLVHKRPNLLILDEPTNHMDIASREALEEALENYPGTLLIVTHDRYLINRLAKKIWELDRGLLEMYQGGFDDYKAESGRKKALAVPYVEEVRHRNRTEPKRTPSTANHKNAVNACAKLEAEIEEMERRLAELDAAMNELESGVGAVPQLERNWMEREVLRDHLDRLIERWMEEQSE